MPLLTLFTAPKPFTDPHIATIQTNTLRNWLALGDEVEIVVIGDEPGIAEVCTTLDLRHLPDVRCNAMGTPLISGIFNLARDVNDSPCLMYCNADILLMPDLMDAVRLLVREESPFLAVGQRYDLDVRESIEFTGDWAGKLAKRIQTEAKLHGQTGSDYFIYPRSAFKEIPDFAVGRAGWDNWMIFRARWMQWHVIDASKAITIIHQNHDYRHLPGGRRHYEQPETAVNIKLAGGRRTIFKLTDATHRLEAGQLRRKPSSWQSFWREVEIFPLVRLHSRVLGWLSFALFHPVLAFKEVKGWLAYKLKRT